MSSGHLQLIALAYLPSVGIAYLHFQPALCKKISILSLQNLCRHYLTLNNIALFHSVDEAAYISPSLGFGKVVNLLMTENPQV